MTSPSSPIATAGEARADHPVGPAGPAPTTPRSLKALAVRGSAFTIASFGTSQVLRLVSNLILTRLLFPEAFGLMALVGVFLQGLELFSDVGIGPSIIRHKRGDDPAFVNTAWTIQVVRGVALTLVALLLAWPMATLWFHKPELTPLMMAAGATSLILGFNSTKIFSANRHLAMGRLMALELASQVVSLAAIVALAYVYRSVWALVIGGFSGAIFKMALSHFLLPGPSNRPHWDREVARELFVFGRWIFLSTLLNFLAAQGDRILLGRYLPEAILGIYSIAFFMSDSAARLVSTLSQKILFPAISRVHIDDPSRVADVFDRVRRRTDALVMPAMGAVIATGPLLIDALYDDRYRAAGPMLQILAFRALCCCFNAPAGHCLTALGKPQFTMLGAGVRCLWLFIGIPLGWTFFGLEGCVWVAGLSDVPPMFVLAWGLSTENLLRLGTNLRAAGLVLAGLSAGSLISLVVGLIR